MPAETEQMFRNESVVGDEALHDAVDTQPVPAEQVVFSIDSEADREQLASAWRALKERHPVLETGMRVLPDGGMALFRRDDCDFEPTFHDWREEPDENAREEKLHRFLSTKRLTGFDLAHPPLIRVAMIRWNETRWRAVLTFVRRTLDWRSLSILIQDFVSGLNVTERAPKATANEPAHVPSIPVRPAGNANDVVFWRKFLSDLKSVNPFDGLNGAGHGLDGESADNIVQQLNRPASNELRQLCKAADVTLNNVVESAWALLMSRYSASRDVAFGIVRSCRRSTAPGNSDLAGFFTNVIPLRVRIDEDANIFELLRQARDQHRLVREHECNDLGVIRRSLREAGSDIALHSVVEFDLRNPMSALEELFAGFGPCDFRHYPGPEHGVRLQVHAEDEITLRLDYSASILDRNAAGRLLDQYGRLLLAMAARPGVAVRNIDFLDEQDKAPITWPGAQRYATSGRSTSIHGGFEDRAALCPDAVAVSCGDTTLTYDELNRAANRLAHRLRRNGVQPDDLVGLCVERSIEQVVGILGILKSGAAYLPLDPSYPAERLKFMLQDAGVDTVVLHDDIESALPGMNARRIGIRIKEEEESSDNPEPRGGGRNLAYVIYTSGSTGQPKGVQVTHHNVMRLFDTCASWLNAGIGDVWTLFHSFAFDFSVWEIWGALLHGGRLEIVLRNVARSPDAFYRLLVDRRVTVLNQTPSAFQQLMRVDAESKGDLSALRLVVFGGVKLDLRSLRSWVRRHGDVSPHLVNMYGITETTVHVTYRPVTERDIEEATSSLIGWPLPDLYVRLLDEKRRPVPPGVRGEICVGGAGVTRGYLNRPELDERKFIADPLSGNPDARLYCSGDFARQASSGELVYLGRDDDQVKIRGFRIDLGEISNTVQDIDGVASAIVIPHETRAGVKRLVAYYVEETPGAMPEASLRDVLSKRLPEHMVPAVMIRLAEIPVNINNKTDLKALPDPSDIPSETVPAEEQPRTPAEKLLADIWSEVLERPVPGRRDDFFGLGGDSVLALQVVSKARAAGLEITPRDLFEHSELSALAAIARQAEAVESDETASTNADAAMALTPIQHWFLDQHFEQPQHFNQARLFKVAPETDIDLLEQACVEVVRRHEALRCRFEEDEQGNRSAHVVSAEDALETVETELLTVARTIEGSTELRDRLTDLQIPVTQRLKFVEAEALTAAHPATRAALAMLIASDRI
ncbi:MAG: amino acid adenylation domain-containing protein, partial [Proteobacteria bacterium]|nr:amino acid adenylation domain-containing protein [Pseudomonadota bacterium]